MKRRRQHAPPAAARRSSKFAWVRRIPYGAWLGLILILLMIHRAYLARTAFIVPHDSGSVGLMALHIRQGERPLFLYGFHYAGALMAYLVAIAFSFLGVSSVSLMLPMFMLTVGWTLAAYFLFRELLGRRAGLAAALCVAFPDWITTWHSLAPDCSYGPLFFLGTLVLCLAVTLATRRLPTDALWVAALSLGLAAGGALWCSFIAAPYLLCGGLLFLPYFAREKRRVKAWLPLLAGGALFLLAVSPYLYSPDALRSSTAATWKPHWSAIVHNGVVLARETIPDMVRWPPVDWPKGVDIALAVLSAAGAALYVAGIWTAGSRSRRLRALVPLLFVGIFLAFFLPHSMADSPVPRYIIPLWTMAVFAMAAVPIASATRWVRLAAAVWLGLWCAGNLAGSFRFARYMAPSKIQTDAENRSLIDNACAAGAPCVVLIGDYYFGAQGQTLSYLARDQVRFVAAGPERYQRAAQIAEGAERVAYACPTDRLDAVTASLDALGATYRVTPDAWACLVHDIQVPRTSRRSVPPAEMTLRLIHADEGAPDALKDRTLGTTCGGCVASNGGFVVDLGRERLIDGLSVCPAERDGLGLPAGYAVAVSADGEAFSNVVTVTEALPVACIAGDRAYLAGHYGWLEIRTAPTSARYLRLEVTRGQEGSDRWIASEVFVFEQLGDAGPDPQGDPARLAGIVRQRGIRFTAADRWLSARLVDLLPAEGGEPPAFPRYNDHSLIAGSTRPIPPREFRAGPARALAVSASVADETEAILRETDAPERVAAGAYTLFLFPPGSAESPRVLQWNGLLPLR